MQNIERRLEESGIKVTAVRILVLKAMLSRPRQAFSLADLEQELDTVDKSTLSRTIHLFHENKLIHSIDDGTGSMKYSVCGGACQCTPRELHTHFHCTRCGKTFCMEDLSIPDVELPAGFRLNSVNFVLKGLCDGCSKFAT